MSITYTIREELPLQSFTTVFQVRRVEGTAVTYTAFKTLESAVDYIRQHKQKDAIKHLFPRHYDDEGNIIMERVK